MSAKQSSFIYNLSYRKNDNIFAYIIQYTVLILYNSCKANNQLILKKYSKVINLKMYTFQKFDVEVAKFELPKIHE